jgi:tRNA-specific 2-thiouridylase
LKNHEKSPESINVKFNYGIRDIMTKVVVAMSGGVDSSVAAVLLQQQGYEVAGMMLRLWSEPGKEESNRCCTPDSMALARRVAARLDIPFYVIDAKDIFRQTVVNYFMEGYAAGGTPNPCLMCNRHIRWEFLLDHALALGADFMATGHYVRTIKDHEGKIRLLRAVDPLKDQSYVLHVLTQEKLAKALFPVGDFPKSEIRKIAAEHSLPVATRQDSQDLCFLAGEDYRDFLKRNSPEMLVNGNIVNKAGQVLGQHTGLPNYTIGQRKGLGVSSPVPLFVISKDTMTNTLVVGNAEELGTIELIATNVNWMSNVPLTSPFQAQVKCRYTAREAPAEVIPQDGGEKVRIIFETKQRDITPGQAAVFYNGDVVLGGGIIISTN